MSVSSKIGCNASLRTSLGHLFAKISGRTRRWGSRKHLDEELGRHDDHRHRVALCCGSGYWYRSFVTSTVHSQNRHQSKSRKHNRSNDGANAKSICGGYDLCPRPTRSVHKKKGGSGPRAEGKTLWCEQAVSSLAVTSFKTADGAEFLTV